MRTHLFVAAIAVSLVAGLPGVAVAQTKPGMAPATPATVDIRVCNRSGRDGAVAISYHAEETGTYTWTLDP